jgi:serine/threonine-protein kinase
VDDVERLNHALAGRYEVEREIGAGGMASIYAARDLKHDRTVALKVLNSELGAMIGVERFLSEVHVTAGLQHPHLLPLFDSGHAGGFLFYVMPYVDGETLRARLERDGQMPIDDAVRIAIDVATALDHAHRHGVLHRDIKPENILLQDDSALVTDFGIALAITSAAGRRLTGSGIRIGTPQYMSPEQATGSSDLDARTDIYALGCVLYEMLAGTAPFTGTSPQIIAAKVLHEEPPPPGVRRDGVPAHVDAAVTTALSKDPAKRFPTARAFADALEGVGNAAGATPPPPDAQALARAVRMWRAVAVAALTLAAAVTVAWLALR